MPNYLEGTFIDNKKKPIHRWFDYLEGYSEVLVKSELKILKDVNRLYDPFSGSGTTPLVGVINGVDSYYSEVNPVMQFVTKVKTCTAFKVAHNMQKVNYLRDVISDIGTKLIPRDTDNPSLNGFEKYYSDNNLRFIIAYKNLIANITDQDVRDILLLALASSAVPTSKMIRRGDLRFAKGQKEENRANQAFKPFIMAKLSQMFEDILLVRDNHVSESVLLSADAREINNYEPNMMDAVITSPPYLNGTNYFRNTKLELKLLDYINSEKDLSAMYDKGIVAGINNVSKRRKILEPMDSVLPYYDKLKTAAYDARIPKMVSGYFWGMDSVIDRLRILVRPKGIVVIDIGDSQFAGVHIPTHDLLSDLFTNHGFVKLSEDVLRHRRSRNGLVLTQRKIRYRRL